MAKGLSIHIGLNRVDPRHYQGWEGKLKACEADANDMEALAKTRGFAPTTLLTADATSKTVVKAITDAAGKLVKGDTLFLTYSGHGGQVPDLNDDEDDDGKDETWVLFDRELVDDELYALWSKFKAGVRIIVLSDSCHSGDVTRGELIRNTMIPAQKAAGMIEAEFSGTREMPEDEAEKTYRANKDEYDEIQRSNPAGDRAPVKAAVLLISGCQSNQLSLDGARNGLFTAKLLATWNKGGFAGSYKLLHRRINAQMPVTQTPNLFPIGSGAVAFSLSPAFAI
ncbi:peptidase C14 [bacterium SCGC AG-212-C10]|nr:peptidase C14 [bacterium SCGC AG-212-C10]